MARRDDAGGTLAGVLITLLVLAVVAAGAFFYFGGRADVDVEAPDVEVTGEPDPPSVTVDDSEGDDS
ncbi:hypothetical protein [Thalassiella azotivora]